MGKSPMTAAVEKLKALGGHGPAKVCEWRIREAIGWQQKAPSAVRHMLRGDRQISQTEAEKIDAAYRRYERQQVIEHISAAIEAAQHCDAEFYQPQIDAMRDLLLRLGGDAHQRRNGGSSADG